MIAALQMQLDLKSLARRHGVSLEGPPFSIPPADPIRAASRSPAWHRPRR